MRPTSSLGPSALPNIDEFINITKLPLSTASYSIVPSASANRLWSYCSFLLLFFVYSRRKGIYGWFLEQPFIKYLNMWHKLVDLTSGRRCLFVFHAYFTLYISHLIPLISTLLILRERDRYFWTPCFCQPTDLVTFAAIISQRPSFSKELLRKFFSFIPSFVFIFLS